MVKKGLAKKANRITMTRGKHRGKPIDILPSKYLLWVSLNWDEETDEDIALVKACDDEYQYRDRYNCHIEED